MNWTRRQALVSLTLPGLLLMTHAYAASGVDISNTKRLLFIADRIENYITVVDPAQARVIFRIETEFPVHDLIITPYAPLLIYANRDQKKLFTYNLANKTWLKPTSLPLTPRHLVLGTAGIKIGITDGLGGGFALVSAYSQKVEFHLPEVPATADVLFDPNEIDIYYTANDSGALGLIDINLERSSEIPLTDGSAAHLSSPSRSLDGRYIYVSNLTTGEVYNMNAYSRVIYKTFTTGETPARPYTTPEGLFLYVMDQHSGRVVAYDQNRFAPYTDETFSAGIDLVTVGRQDRMNLFMSTSTRNFHLYDNARKQLRQEGQFRGTPLDAKGSVDGKMAYVTFVDAPDLALVNLESGDIRYLPVTGNGAGAFGLGLSNNVCH
ncbi:MAG: hypothetical protein RQ899_10985 [Pseudomonadales bacterium]|nr:hypothetical protein [Pseudomonadales bacterium]